MAESTAYGTLCRESGHLVRLRKGANIASPSVPQIPLVHVATFLALPSGSIRAGPAGIGDENESASGRRALETICRA